MINFLSAKELKQKYIVFGSFYYLRISSTQSLPCRNCLDILDREESGDIEVPEVLFIMMNPGSSAPLEDDIELPEYDADEIAKRGEVPIEWVPAKPDITQYQVMRVMTAKGWRYARVINLSDLREPRSKVFQENIATLKTGGISELHSIFSPARALELKKILELENNAPIILAWGTDEFLIDLAKSCFTRCDLRKAKGVSSGKSKYLFSHASPTLQEHKERWLESILKIV